ncbi:hypothetical protein L596_017517 [Steinernema carpocapsae]|uniref:Uncharacterized protein n=1 Tax=Steinernema carpocapsae TaxID=34508 RepID=A0A4U5N256_STECR|nr:hypothetical protein L596_017517 [Steinernema carpocapsae]
MYPSVRASRKIPQFGPPPLQTGRFCNREDIEIGVANAVMATAADVFGLYTCVGGAVPVFPTAVSNLFGSILSVPIFFAVKNWLKTYEKSRFTYYPLANFLFDIGELRRR